MEILLAKLKDAFGGDEAKASEALEKAKADGVLTEDDAKLATVDDWKGYGLPTVQARKLAAALNKVAAPAATGTARTTTAMLAMLPTVPDDITFLEKLKTGGTLLVPDTDVVAAVRVLYAQRYGLFEVEGKVVAAIEQQTVATKRQYPQVYWDIQAELQIKAHSEIFSALKMPGKKVMSARNTREFLDRMVDIWGVMGSFQQQLDAYHSTWMTQVTNPSVLLSGMAAMMNGGAGMAMPGMNEAPDPSGIADAACAVRDDINAMFVGAGVLVARALAADALQIRQVLDNPELPAATGAATYQDMIERLGLAVSSDKTRTEQMVTKYVLSVVTLPDKTTEELPYYILQLKQLGTSIPWEQLRSGGRNSSARPGKTERPGHPTTF